MAKQDDDSSSSSCKGIGSPLAKSQHESPGSGSFSGAVEGGKSFIKPAALSESRKKAWQNAKGFVSAVSSTTVSGSQTCNTERSDDWLKHRTFAALKLEIDDSPMVSCLRHNINCNVPPAVGSALSAAEDHNRMSSSSGQYNTQERFKKAEEASVSSFDYHQIAPQVKDSSQDNLWQQLKVVGSCDSSRGSVMKSMAHPHLPLSSAKASTGTFHNVSGSFKKPSVKNSCSSHYIPNMVPSSSLTTSDSDASGDHNRLATRLSKLGNRLKGGGSSVEVSDGSPVADVTGMKTLIERQRQSYIRRLKREIQWLEKVEKLLMEAQGRKRDSAFTKRAVEIAMQRVGSQTEERSCHACHGAKAGAVAALLEESASVYSSPLFVRCDFLKRFQGNENVDPAHNTKGNQILPRDLFKTDKGFFSALGTRGAECEDPKLGNENLQPENTHNKDSQQIAPPKSSFQNEKSAHYSDNVGNQTVTLSYQQLTNGETTLENGLSAERTSSRASKPFPASNKVELTSTPYSCQVCRHHCPCLVKLSGIAVDDVHSNMPTNSHVRANRLQNQSCTAWLRSSINPPSFCDNSKASQLNQDRVFVSIPVPSSPRVAESKNISSASVKRSRASPPKNLISGVSIQRKTACETPADKPKVIRTQRLSKSGIAWYIPVHEQKPWLQHRGCGDGSMTEVEIVHAQNSVDDTIARSVEELTLQDAFRRFKPTFILRSQARIRKMKVAARQRRHRVQARAVALTRNRQFMATMPSEFIDQLHRPCKRNFSHQEMRLQTERIYRTLPEFQQQIDYKRRKEAYRTNRLMAEIYKRKVLQKTLAGKVSYAITEKLL